MVEVRDGSIFDMKPPSLEWAKALHSFAWLPPLALAGGEPARVLAMNLMTQWLKRHARYSGAGMVAGGDGAAARSTSSRTDG